MVSLRPMLRAVPVLMLLASSASAQTYSIGRQPSADELAQDITISPTGAGLPVGHGTAAEGEVLFTEKNCVVCHGVRGEGSSTSAPNLVGNKGVSTDASPWKRVNGGEAPGALPILAPSAIIVWDYIHRGMPLGDEGSLTPDQVYALTAYLLALDKITSPEQVVDQDSLPKIKMPIGTDWARVPDWHRGGQRLPGYPY
jgi:mono/diheme cytochrome c family protein